MDVRYVYRATCVRVIDGDTFEAEVDLGFYVRCRIKVRVQGIDTPERNEPGWAEATDKARALLLGTPLVLQSYHDRRTFERWVCDVWLPDGRTLVEAMVA